MSIKVSSKNCIPKATTRKAASKLSVEVAKQRKDMKECLKLLDCGELQLVDIPDLQEELMAKPHLGDHLQFQLHKYCQKDINQTNSELVVKLVEICYSPHSVSKFTNVDRFLGCVFYISNYLLKQRKFESALCVVQSLGIKKDEILHASTEKLETRITLCNIHSTFIAAAITLVSKANNSSKGISRSYHHRLSMESLEVLKLINVMHVEIGKKVLKTSVLYLQTVKTFTDEEVQEFYSTLNTILKILLPKMESLDLCFHYLHKLNQSKKLDLETDATQVLKKTIYLLTIYLNSSVSVTNSLNKLVDFFFNRSCNKIQTCGCSSISKEDFELLNKQHLNSPVYFLIVSTIFNYGIQYLWKKYEQNWCENISSELVKNFCNCLLYFHTCQSRNKKFYCSSGPLDCCFGDLISGNLSKVQYTIRLCLKNKVPDALSLVLISREAFKKSMECLEYMESEGCCMEQRSYSWKYSVIHHTNTVEDICRHVPSKEAWVLLKECSEEVIRTIVRSNLELPFDFKRIGILFQRWHTSSLKLKNYRDALNACVVYYVFYPKEEKEIMSMWLQAKSECSNEVIEEMTMSEMLKSSDKSLKEFCSSYDSSKINWKHVLLMEIKAYSFCPPAIFQNPNVVFDLATRIWKQLEKSQLDLWETSFALSALISVHVAGENKKLSNALLEKSQKLIDSLLKSKNKMQGRSLLHAANLNFSLFLYNVKLAESSEGQMDTTHMVLEYLKKAEEEKVKFGEDVDLNLTCDIIPSSSHLTVELETNYLDKLSKIVDLWNSAMRIGFDDLPSTWELDLWERNVKQVAHLYTLYGEYRGAFATWLLYYKIGKLRENFAAILLGLSHLLENCMDVDESGIKEEAELALGKLGSEEAEKYIAVEYTLAMAANYLKNKQSGKCLEYLTTTKKILEGLRHTVMSCALNAKFWCLVSKFLILYKEHETVFDYHEGTDARVMAFKAFNYANGAGRSDLIKTAAQSECTELVLAMLHVNLWAYYLHGVFRQTDFMRFFLDDLYQIVQKLLLPTRTAEMLVRLAEVDIICEKVDDCQGKLTKLKSILTTLPSRCSESLKSETLPSPSLVVPEKNDFEIPSPRPISPARFLDKPFQSKDADLSPFHNFLTDVKPSKNSEHLRKCKCRLCENLLIQSLTLNTIWLEAEIYNLRNCSKQAVKCYIQGHDMLKKLEFLRAEQSKNLRLELAAARKEVPGELDLQLVPLQFLSARFLIKYSLFESTNLNSVTDNVIKTMQRINTLMKNFSYEVKLLHWTFAELKLVCVMLLKKNSNRPRKSTTPVQLKTVSITKTPFAGGSATAGTRIERTRTRKKDEVEPVEGSKALNTVTKDAGETCSLRGPLQRRKLNFDAIEFEDKTETVRKFPSERATVIQSRKLDFDLSGDMFEEIKPSSQGQKNHKTTSENKVTELPSSKPKKGITANAVNVYLDSKEESKRKKKPLAGVKIYKEPKDEPKKKKTTVRVQSKTQRV